MHAVIWLSQVKCLLAGCWCPASFSYEAIVLVVGLQVAVLLVIQYDIRDDLILATA